MQVPDKEPPNVQFVPGEGFDVYVDAARYLPTDIIATKISVKIMDHEYMQVGQVLDAVSRLDSTAKSPKFYARCVCVCPPLPASGARPCSACVRMRRWLSAR